MNLTPEEFIGAISPDLILWEGGFDDDGVWRRVVGANVPLDIVVELLWGEEAANRCLDRIAVVVDAEGGA